MSWKGGFLTFGRFGVDFAETQLWLPVVAVARYLALLSLRIILPGRLFLTLRAVNRKVLPLEQLAQMHSCIANQLGGISTN